PLHRLVDRGGGLLGICNGFQVLVKTGFLPGGEVGRGHVTVTYNDSARFEARWVRLEVCTDRCPFLTPVDRKEWRAAGFSPRGDPERAAGFSPRGDPERAAGFSPRGDSIGQERQIASGRPRGLKPSARDMNRLYLELPVEHAEGKVVTASENITIRLKEHGQIAVRYVDTEDRHDTYPANPNGSVAGIAGLCDPTGRIFGLMPHPDRHFEHTHHPHWTRRTPEGPPDGLTVFQNAVRYWSTHK
ncbi:MAG: phosphoribosylformylglycinamidine synthase subunit PurQ, partial [Phycisphaerae bacterium]